jgi:hypothetical protein
MQVRDVFTLVKDALCMIVGLGGAIYEARRTGDPRMGLLAFYALLLGFGMAVPAAVSLFGQANQPVTAEPTPAAPAPPVDLVRRDRRRGGDGTTRRR